MAGPANEVKTGGVEIRVSDQSGVKPNCFSYKVWFAVCNTESCVYFLYIKIDSLCGPL